MKRESRVPLIVAIVLLLLPVLYLGSYLALVKPGPDDFRSYAVSLTPSPGFYDTNYRFANPLLSRVYWPLEKIDRKLRPGAWE
ncbi:hypothetical protein [Anatilimnocola floriformis]|uniref:hypothetical protein n=1 Tax=Anatilimnocola floriformis TaxID=2948575 RepID=UPI0020C3673C|nr:hypothetical protein [Anatilimnocola floriformis]